MRLAHIAHTGPAWKKKKDQKDKDIRKGEKGALYAKCQKQEERELGCSPQIGSPPRGLSRSPLPTLPNYTDCTYNNTLDESSIATQVTMLSISRNIEYSVRGTYYTHYKQLLRLNGMWLMI